MYKMNNNLNIINKTILYSSSIIDEDIDFDLFFDLIRNNMDFIYRSLNFLWDEYLKSTNYYDRENFLKTYYFIIKRFHKFLFKLKEELFHDNNNTFDAENITEIIDDVQDRINMIRVNKYQIKFTDTKHEIINEKEYSMLFEDFEIKDESN